MPERVNDLPKFLLEVANVLKTISQCRAVLFRSNFRKRVPAVVRPAVRELKEIASSLKRLEREAAIRKNLHAAGLDGAQLQIKLESFEFSLFQFEADGGETNLQDVLDRSHIILNSLAGAIPVVGPLAKELVDFFNKELRRRFRNSGTL
jgi:hypothetical protein